MSSLVEPTAVEQFVEMLDREMTIDEARTLLEEQDVWLIPGLMYERTGARKIDFTLVLVLVHGPEVFRGWLAHNRPALAQAFAAAEALVALRTA